jgi:FHA domain
VPAMADRDDRTRRPARPPLRAATRRKWLAASAAGGLWLLLYAGTSSMVLASVMFLLLTLLAGVGVVMLRSLGIDGDHPWVQRLAERPWRDGREVLQQGLRHLPELFLVTPSGSLLAPNAVELRMNPDDLAELTGMMDLGLINSNCAEVYESQIAEHGARLGSDGPVEVRVVGDPSVPAGRYQMRQGQPVSAAKPAAAAQVVPAQPFDPAPPFPPAQPFAPAQPARAVVPVGSRVPFNAHDGRTWAEDVRPAPAAADLLTVAETPLIPPLRLVTNGSVVETRRSGAHAGRGPGSELVLPAEPTVSRVHAKFVFTGGQWWVTSLGRNGITLNGVPVAGERSLSDGDRVLWGSQPGALMSLVRIG